MRIGERRTLLAQIQKKNVKMYKNDHCLRANWDQIAKTYSQTYIYHSKAKFTGVPTKIDENLTLNKIDTGHE